MKPASVIKAIITVILLLAVLCAAGIAFVPSILMSLDNGAEHDCLKNSRAMLSLLDDKMSADEDNIFWYNLLAEGNSSKLINALNREMDEPVDVSGYYIKFNGNYVRMLCSKHPRTLDVEATLPDHPVYIERFYNEPQSPFVTTIHAYGQDAYFAGVPLDAWNPEKMIFTDADDTNALFSGITVTASYAGGGERVLNTDEYKIYVGYVDMSQPAHRKLLIEYKLYPWRTMLTTFDIDIIPNDRIAPLIVSGTDGGRYEINSWDWMDYFADSLDAEEEYMEFTPSVVRDGGKYYYFPDGFAIIKESEYNGSVMGARDLDEHDEPAYYVIFETDPSADDNTGETIIEGRTLVDDEGNVYIWQNQPSKEFDAGWLPVFGEVARIEN